MLPVPSDHSSPKLGEVVRSTGGVCFTKQPVAASESVFLYSSCSLHFFSNVQRLSKSLSCPFLPFLPFLALSALSDYCTSLRFVCDPLPCGALHKHHEPPTDYCASLRFVCDPSARQGSKVANQSVLRTAIFIAQRGLCE